MFPVNQIGINFNNDMSNMISMGFFSSMNENKEVNGLIEYFELNEWFATLSEEEKQKMRKYSSMGIGGNPDCLEHGDISSSQTIHGFLSGIGYNAVFVKDFIFAEKILLKTLSIPDCNPLDYHFITQSLIELYYKQRDIVPNAIDKCIDYCIKDIKQIEIFIETWNKEQYRIGIPKNQIILPHFLSLERLAIIYEKQGKIREAIEICNIALKYNFRDSTKGGFEGRLIKLQKKLI
jgi:hypothetical protein